MWTDDLNDANGVNGAENMNDGTGENEENPKMAQTQGKPKKYLLKEPPANGFTQQGIIDQIKLSFDSCAGLLNPNNREKCFEIFGFDFMIDEEYRIWLIECNSVPSLSESNPFLTSYFNRLLGNSKFIE
jgi:Tubulin-tyrosine ligase family